MTAIPSPEKPIPSMLRPSGALLPGIPAQPTASQSADTSAPTEAKLRDLLCAHGITLEIRPRGEGRDDTSIDFGRDEAGGYVFRVGPDRDPAEALGFARTVIERHSILPLNLDPQYMAGRKLMRLVPAKVGPSGRTQIIHIECPEWCVVDHMDRMAHLDDVMHYSDCDVVQVSTLSDDDFAHSELYANISSDPSAADPRLRAAHITVNGGSSTDAYLTADMAEELADELIAFAAQVRHKARIVRLHNQAGQ
ncbi:hypothetical protein AB0M39_25770 [Streptomyces sp. NPDC051907]|uniref:DUF6907 domain-containing protein n=1 Tax=Streptomyces sp. NPDC051907 TaxID=3155284 RepID=UPI00343F3BAF